MKHIIAGIASLGFLTGCINDGSVPDTHPITFESQVPAGGPSRAQAEDVLRSWLVQYYPDGRAARDVSVGPIRYAKVILLPPQSDFFVCAQFTPKNRYGTYMPPQNVLMTIRPNNRADGWRLALIKRPKDGAYRQYCISQPHS